MPKRLSGRRGYCATHDERTDGEGLPVSGHERDEDHQEFEEDETDPCSSCHEQPDPAQLEVCSWREAFSQRYFPRKRLCHIVAQMHAFAPATSAPGFPQEGRSIQVDLFKPPAPQRPSALVVSPSRRPPRSR